MYPAPRSLQEDLFDELQGKALGFRQLRNGHHLTPELLGESDTDKRPKGVLAPLGQIHAGPILV
jgi:hypothetical protein